MVLAEETQYYSGQGQVTYAERNAEGQPEGGLIFLGPCDKSVQFRIWSLFIHR